RVALALAGGLTALGGMVGVLLLTTDEKPTVPASLTVAAPAPPAPVATPLPPPEPSQVSVTPAPPPAKSAPVARKSTLETTKLERVLAPGERRDFWLENSFELKPAVVLEKPGIV